MNLFYSILLLLMFLSINFSCSEEPKYKMEFHFVRALADYDKNGNYMYDHYIYVENFTPDHWNNYEAYVNFICNYYYNKPHKYSPVHGFVFIRSKEGLANVDYDEIQWSTLSKNFIISYSLSTKGEGYNGVGGFSFHEHLKSDTLFCPPRENVKEEVLLNL